MDYVPDDPTDKFPRVPLDLLEALELAFPDKAPSITTADRQIWVNVGHAEVVRFLRDMHERPPQLKGTNDHVLGT